MFCSIGFGFWKKELMIWILCWILDYSKFLVDKKLLVFVNTDFIYFKEAKTNKRNSRHIFNSKWGRNQPSCSSKSAWNWCHGSLKFFFRWSKFLIVSFKNDVSFHLVNMFLSRRQNLMRNLRDETDPPRVPTKT